MIIKFILSLALFYVTAMAAIYFAQTLFIYLPETPTRNLEASPTDIDLLYDNVFLTTKDQIKIHAWHIPASQAEKTILFMHGNAGNISHRLETIQIYNQLGFNILIFDYRGYGESGGKPSERGTYLDAISAWDYLIKEKNVRAENIIVVGRSLGGGVASELAKNVTPAMLILESTFSSMSDISKEHYPFMPTNLIVKHKYNTVNKLKEISCPIVVVHSKDDELIPFSHGQLIYDYANSPKYFIELRGGHGNGFMLSKHEYISGLQHAFQTML